MPPFFSRQIVFLCICLSKDCIVARVFSRCDPEPRGLYSLIIICETPSKIHVSFYSFSPVICWCAWFRLLVDGMHYYLEHLRDQIERYDIVAYARIVRENGMVPVIWSALLRRIYLNLSRLV